MSDVYKPGLRQRLTIFVCVTLAILFLYNPYVTLTSSSSGQLNVQHILSYRATLGSSELQHFSPPDERKIFATSISVVPTWLASSVNFLVEQAPEVFPHEFCAYQLVSEDLWFRPPPVNLVHDLYHSQGQ